MLRTNLSTRPFYNERLVSFIIAIVGIAAIAVLVVSVQQILSLSSTRTRLRDQMTRDQNSAGLADTEALALQKQINNKSLKGLAVSAQQANTLIDERTFSWTAFFGLIEKTLPNDVRVVSVAPVIDKTGVLVQMTVISKRPEDLAKFIEGMQGTGAFYDVLPKQEDSTDDGNRRTSIEARYLPSKTVAPAPAADTAAAPAKPAAGAPATEPMKHVEDPNAPDAKAPAKPAPAKSAPVKKGGDL